MSVNWEIIMSTNTNETMINVPNGMWKTALAFSAELISAARLIDQPVCMEQFIRDKKNKRVMFGAAWSDGRSVIFMTDIINLKKLGWDTYANYPESVIRPYIVKNFLPFEIENTTWMNQSCRGTDKLKGRRAFIKEMENQQFLSVMTNNWSRLMSEIPGTHRHTPANRDRYSYLASHSPETYKEVSEIWEAMEDSRWITDTSGKTMMRKDDGIQVIKIKENVFIVVDEHGNRLCENTYKSFGHAKGTVNRMFHIPLVTTDWSFRKKAA